MATPTPFAATPTSAYVAPATPTSTPVVATATPTQAIVTATPTQALVTATPTTPVVATATPMVTPAIGDDLGDKVGNYDSGLVDLFFESLTNNSLSPVLSASVKRQYEFSVPDKGILYTDVYNWNKLDDNQFVTGVYTGYLGYRPSDDDLTLWTERLKTGYSRRIAFIMIVEDTKTDVFDSSKEFDIG